MVLTAHETTAGNVSGGTIVPHGVDCTLNLRGDPSDPTGYREIGVFKNRSGRGGGVMAFCLGDGGCREVPRRTKPLVVPDERGSERPRGEEYEGVREGPRERFGSRRG